MREFDIKSDMPTVAVAQLRLSTILGLCKGKEKIIKIIHGYGSHGSGGAIRTAIRTTLSEKRRLRQIKAFIPGEATVDLMGFDADIRQYKKWLENDEDFRRGNDGITYVIL
ncbi:MAG TPA: hypothetical protein P5154_02885 [Candidatus Izemoplasmatales bacterium]|nr:hypothetical protein [Bacillota bacterium]HRY77689.1 hypothetical protein [Candidatus Izemoplasmatales bacterium]